jgi:hypothetical protein
VLLAGCLASAARALDFDDEDPKPPHPEIGLVYHYEIGTHAGCLPHHLVILSGQLPPGLTLTQLNDHTGLVSGVATESGTFSVWLAVRDCENKSAETLFTFEVWARRYSIATQSLPSGDVGTPYSATLQTSGIPSTTTWQVTSGALPPGLTLSKDGVIAGTPTAVGSASFTVQATGNALDFSGTRIDTRQYTLNITALAVRLSSTTAEVGLPFRTSLVASGGQGPYSSTVTGVPPGLTAAGDGTLSGVPSRAGVFALAGHVVDANGAVKDVTLRLVVRARLGLPAGALRSAHAGRSYRAKLTVRGGVGGLRWSVAGGRLPGGLTLSGRSGTIAGVPRSAGTYRLKIRVRDRLGAVAARAFVLVVR